ncbi:type II toxin-antitoxin system VapC family toxin [Sporichthya sp.]|uniref:type II toxin-antitoxin system VapC family toxin n=1 Tax=Sporichthya sp. TaxID=65475 RepID=UPI00185497D0|nr:type II toxin-antitoxin system VapC family toxin [Sporichthya sp.]MBA3743328.1 type II toxin-antitoxin system VapC family toxin [Sporichthya sp.]
MTLAVDASFVVAALVDSGPEGSWADALLDSDDLVAPHLMQVEAANIIRRTEAAGQIAADTAALAHADLLEVRVALFAYEPFAPRVWELRHHLPAYDALYVAIAETLDADLATLDRRLARATGPRCGFRLPPGSG